MPQKEILMASFVHVCSVGKVPREPKLVEWTERASKFDKLKATVYIYIFICSLHVIIVVIGVLVEFYHLVFFFVKIFVEN